MWVKVECRSNFFFFSFKSLERIFTDGLILINANVNILFYCKNQSHWIGTDNTKA